MTDPTEDTVRRILSDYGLCSANAPSDAAIDAYEDEYFDDCVEELCENLGKDATALSSSWTGYKPPGHSSFVMAGLARLAPVWSPADALLAESSGEIEAVTIASLTESLAAERYVGSGQWRRNYSPVPVDKSLSSFVIQAIAVSAGIGVTAAWGCNSACRLCEGALSSIVDASVFVVPAIFLLNVAPLAAAAFHVMGFARTQGNRSVGT